MVQAGRDLVATEVDLRELRGERLCSPQHPTHHITFQDDDDGGGARARKVADSNPSIITLALLASNNLPFQLVYPFAYIFVFISFICQRIE